MAWIKEFLTNRKQRVAVSGVLSRESAVISGVPQGSVLGPLLFLIYVNDISDVLSQSDALLFADDTKIIKTIKGVSDCEILQDDLLSIYEWGASNNMNYNGSKFQLVRYSASGDPIDFSYLSSEETEIKAVSNARDLGLIMSDTAKFDNLIQVVVKKAMQRMRSILRVFRTREREPMLILFRTLVLPLLEYCVQLWHPLSLGSIRDLEAILRTFTSKIAGNSHLNYWERLQKLKMYSLERRRERYIVMYVWKIINCLVPNIEGRDRITIWQSDRRGLLCRVPPIVRSAGSRVQTLRDNSFCVVGPRLFNSLPMALRGHRGSPDAFKRALDDYLSIVPDRPCIAGYQQSMRNNSIISQVIVR